MKSWVHAGGQDGCTHASGVTCSYRVLVGSITLSIACEYTSEGFRWIPRVLWNTFQVTVVCSYYVYHVHTPHTQSNNAQGVAVISGIPLFGFLDLSLYIIDPAGDLCQFSSLLRILQVAVDIIIS